MKVAYVSGRKKALARAVAMQLYPDWESLSVQEKTKKVEETIETLNEWIRNGVLVTFDYERRE